MKLWLQRALESTWARAHQVEIPAIYACMYDRCKHCAAYTNKVINLWLADAQSLWENIFDN